MARATAFSKNSFRAVSASMRQCQFSMSAAPHRRAASAATASSSVAALTNAALASTSLPRACAATPRRVNNKALAGQALMHVR